MCHQKEIKNVSLSPNLLPSLNKEKNSDGLKNFNLNKLEGIKELAISKSPSLQKRNEMFNIPELVKESKEMMKSYQTTKARITNFKKAKFNKNNEKDSDSCEDLIENDLIKINKPLRISKLSNLTSTHESK